MLSNENKTLEEIVFDWSDPGLEFPAEVGMVVAAVMRAAGIEKVEISDQALGRRLPLRIRRDIYNRTLRIELVGGVGGA